ncbi:transposase [Methylobacterium sp. DB0501]|nr:transposase [Methylobacterium sp. DB0501]
MIDSVARRRWREDPIWTQANRDLSKDDGYCYPCDLTDAQWALIAPTLPSDDPLKVDLREVVTTCLYQEKTGCPWRCLPSDFGPMMAHPAISIVGGLHIPLALPKGRIASPDRKRARRLSVRPGSSRTA